MFSGKSEIILKSLTNKSSCRGMTNSLYSVRLHKHRRGRHGGIRLINPINDQPSVTVIEELLAIGVGVKHIANLHYI